MMNMNRGLGKRSPGTASAASMLSFLATSFYATSGPIVSRAPCTAQHDGIIPVWGRDTHAIHP